MQLFDHTTTYNLEILSLLLLTSHCGLVLLKILLLFSISTFLKSFCTLFIFYFSVTNYVCYLLRLCTLLYIQRYLRTVGNSLVCLVHVKK